MKAKELLKILSTVSPESNIKVAKGFVEEGTSNVEVFEEYGQVIIQEKEEELS